MQLVNSRNQTLEDSKLVPILERKRDMYVSLRSSKVKRMPKDIRGREDVFNSTDVLGKVNSIPRMAPVLCKCSASSYVGQKDTNGHLI